MEIFKNLAFIHGNSHNPWLTAIFCLTVLLLTDRNQKASPRIIVPTMFKGKKFSIWRLTYIRCSLLIRVFYRNNLTAQDVILLSTNPQNRTCYTQ